jgi:NTE family protein
MTGRGLRRLVCIGVFAMAGAAGWAADGSPVDPPRQGDPLQQQDPPQHGEPTRHDDPPQHDEQPRPIDEPPEQLTPGAAFPGRPRVALVLSGGGARGFAHVGVLRVLESMQIPVDIVTGTSMGAIIGGAYAAGYSVAELDALVRFSDWKRVFDKRAPRADLPWRRKEDDLRNLSDFEFGIHPDGITLPRGLAGTQRLELQLRALGGPAKEVRNLSELPLPFAAMATDLETGKVVELQNSISLSKAMRASMAVPGAFSPVEHEGHLLIDGGIVNNLPVDKARAMGADIIIAVNVSTPLLPRDQLTNVVAVAEQLTLILGHDSVQRQIAQLGPEDILIEPEFDGLGASGFDRGARLIGIGEAAARKVAERLAALAVTLPAYAQWEQRRTGLARSNAPVAVAQLDLEGLKTVNPEALRRQVEFTPGRLMTAAEVERVVQRVYGTGDFESVNYSLLDRDGERHLVISPVEKSWGYNTLRFGGRLQSDFGRDTTFTLLAVHTWGWLNAWGGEWRNTLQLGPSRLVSTDFLQPLGPGSRWFLLPRIAWGRTQFDLYREDSDTPYARASASSLAVGVGLGYTLPALGYVALRRERSSLSASTLIGDFPLDGARQSVNDWVATLSLDTLDSVTFPHEGWQLFAEGTDYGTPVSSAQRARSTQLQALVAHSFGRNTLVGTLATGRSVQTGGFQLGGFLNLSGTPVGRYSGSRLLSGSVIAFRNVSDALGDVALPVYLGGSFELGAVASGDVALSSQIRRAVSLFVATDTVLGPVYLGAGRTLHGRTAFYLFWGRF